MWRDCDGPKRFGRMCVEESWQYVESRLILTLTCTPFVAIAIAIAAPHSQTCAAATAAPVTTADCPTHTHLSSISLSPQTSAPNTHPASHSAVSRPNVCHSQPASLHLPCVTTPSAVVPPSCHMSSLVPPNNTTNQTLRGGQAG
ncbi:hypothetical protein E2C01_049913 [Portunus trituberculatus]|uniref:Uncharacterized protein n=1 Tax=Portunus trituberculatus TaxID=210409 RepID=A0A5B7GF25_PORTR|nr:hypothetical protein [Portunus trituberculatus]